MGEKKKKGSAWVAASAGQHWKMEKIVNIALCKNKERLAKGYQMAWVPEE